MTLDEAIKHAEKVAEREQCKGFDANIKSNCKTVQGERHYKCANEHRQLAEWLKELKRARHLLKATYDLLEKQYRSPYVLNLLSETIFYDEAECDGNCLMEDIENLLEYGL